MGDGLAGVGVGHSPGDRPGRLQRDRDRLRIRAGLDPDRGKEDVESPSIDVFISLDHGGRERETRVAGDEVSQQAPAQAAQDEAAVGVAGRRAGPGGRVAPLKLGEVWPEDGRWDAPPYGLAERPDPQHDASRGLTVEVEEPPADDL